MSVLKTAIRCVALALTVSTLAACAASVSPPPSRSDIGDTKPLHKELRGLPAPERKVYVAVYGFPDQTGQFKPSESFQTLSRAVTQGADSILIDTLKIAGDGAWFSVVERSNLNNVLKERQIINEMRKNYRRQDGSELPAPRPMLYAGVLLEGGIVGFDSNTRTGGLGARFLGIGGDVEYREDVVTVYLRAVSTQTGEILASVRTSKRIISYGAAANVFRFVSFRELLEVDAGLTSNEPGTLALRQAIELALYALIMEGSEAGLWTFADAETGDALLQNYYKRIALREQYMELSDADVAARLDADGAAKQEARRAPAFDDR
jgi:curli production assembly/transport component CsgG